MSDTPSTTTQTEEVAPVKRGRKAKAAPAPAPAPAPQVDPLPTKQEIAEHVMAFAKCAEFEKNTLPQNAQNSFASEMQYRFSRLMQLTK